MLLLLYPHSWVFILSQDITDLIISIESETENESNYQRQQSIRNEETDFLAPLYIIECLHEQSNNLLWHSLIFTFSKRMSGFEIKDWENPWIRKIFSWRCLSPWSMLSPGWAKQRLIAAFMAAENTEGDFIWSGKMDLWLFLLILLFKNRNSLDGTKSILAQEVKNKNKEMFSSTFRINTRLTINILQNK